jgi:hypothetical protein
MNNSDPAFAATRPYSLRIFVPDGKPDGLRVIEKSNWTGLGLVFPRSEFAAVKSREEFERTGVYILAGPSEEGDQPTIYVGQGDPVKPRLENHYGKKDFWTWGVFFVTKDNSLNKAHIGHLELGLIDLAKKARRCQLDNSNTPNPSPLSEAEAADMDSFLADILSILPLVGLNVFERPRVKTSNHQTLQLDERGVTARGYESAEGFVVVAGSQAHSEALPSLRGPATARRQSLIDAGVIIPQDGDLVFADDYSFTSPSLASSIILGRSSNGRITWKDSSGVSLKELQENDV